MGSRRSCHCKYEPKIHTTFALFLMLMGCLTLVIFATRAIPSYRYTRDFVETTCTVENTNITVNVCCEASVTSIDTCMEGYSYPCGELEVTYNKDGDTKAAILFDEHHSLAFASQIEKCSYFHCYSTSYENRLKQVEEFLEEYGNEGDEHTCYYDPQNEEYAVLNITSYSDLLHAVLWPIILIILSTIIFIVVVIIRKKRLDPLDEDDDDDESSEDTKSGKSDVNTALTGASRSSSESSMLTPPQREEIPPESPEKWAKEPKSRGSSARPTTRSAIHFEMDSPTKDKKNNVKNTKKSDLPKKNSKSSLNLTPVNA